MRKSFHVERAAVAILITVSGAFGLSSQAISAPEDKPEQIVAEQVRRQGYPCAEPLSAKRDSKDSQPHGIVWILECEGARYSVPLIPHRAAAVEKLDQSK